MSNIKVRTLKGFRDFLPEQTRKRQYVINKLKKVFETFGFEPLETPALEYEEILLGKYGTEGDKLMYRFTDNGDRKVALRYDQTVPLARVVAQYQYELPIPFKRYQIQPVWRAENTQKGRFREFIQCDADIVGTLSPVADAEVIATAARSLDELGFKDYKILINDRKNFSLTSNTKLSDNDFFNIIRAIDKLKKIGKERVLREITETGLSQTEAEQIINEIETRQQSQYLQEVFSLLTKQGIKNTQYYPTLARGLDYYTGLIFEAEIEGYSAGSVCGGGRYDNLIGMFAGRQIPAVGFAFGFDRLIEAMDQFKLFPSELTTTQVLITIFNKELFEKSIQVCKSLRTQGINSEIWLDLETKLDKQLKYADLKKIPYVAIIGPDEVSKGMLTLKDLKNKTQQTLTAEEVILKFKMTNNQ